MGRRSFLKHFVPFPGASPFLTATVLRPPSGQLPPPQYVYPVAYGGPVFGQRGCRRALPRSGRESGEHGSRGLWRMQWLWPVGPREGGVFMHAEHAAGTTACRIGTGPQRTGSLRSLLCARMVEAKKACAPFGDTGRKSRLVKGEFWGEALSHRQQRCDRMAAAGRARCDAGSYGHRQQRCDRMAAAGRARSRERRLTGSPATRRGPKTQRRWRYGPDGHRRQDAG